MDINRIPPAGDPFYAASPYSHHDHRDDRRRDDDHDDLHGRRRDPDGEETPHGCYEGFVYIGYMVEDPETGEEVVVIECVPCRRCAAAKLEEGDECE